MATATLTEFRNEPYADFSQPAIRRAMEEALRQVRSEFGREYQLRIGSEYISTGDKLESVNPSNPSEIVGVHHRGADAVFAARAVEAAWKYFPEWSRVPAEERIGMTFEAARILRPATPKIKPHVPPTIPISQLATPALERLSLTHWSVVRPAPSRDSLAIASRCCTTWVNSWARSRLPCGDCGSYRPWSKNISLP